MTTAPCTLYTLEGLKPATATRRDTTTYMIRADDGTAAIIVRDTTVTRKFSQEDKPTFYAC